MKNDAVLIEEAKAGDSEAFGALVGRYQSRLFHTLIKVTGRREEAEDVLQDAFVQAYVKLNTFHGKSAFFTWLYRIAFNLSVSRRRRRRPEVSVEVVREAVGADPESQCEQPEEKLMRQERAQKLHVAMDRLNEEHRAILVLREMEGCCYDTIAEILSIPPGTVRSRLHRARLTLREQLKEVLEENPIE